MPDRRSAEAIRESQIEFDFINKHGMKICRGCKKMKAKEFFKTQKSRPHGIGSHCKDCAKISQRQYMNSEHGYFTEMLNSMRKALRKGRVGMVEFQTQEDLLDLWREQQEMYGNFCPGTGRPLTMIRNIITGNNNRIPTNLSPDRILNWEGYTRINTIFVSWEYNNMKNNLTPEIAINFLHMVKARFGDIGVSHEME